MAATFELDKLAERFWQRVERSPDPGACWLWTGFSDGGFGYGRMYIGGGRKGRRQERAHRVSWVLHHGAIPEGQLVLHQCDNPLCVRPDHLFLGTDGDNAYDCMNKGRRPGKLPGDVRQQAVHDILAGRVSQKDTAIRLGIDPSTVSKWMSARRRAAARVKEAACQPQV